MLHTHKKQGEFGLGFVIALWSLTFLFCLRVVGQLVQHLIPVPWLPPFVRWQGSSMPYWLLLLIQLVIVVIMVRVTCQYTSGNVERKSNKGKLLLAFGALYFISMAGRLIIGVTRLSEAPWFDKTIPAIFHFVLASFILLLGAYHTNWIGNREN